MVFKNLGILVLLTKVASTLEGFKVGHRDFTRVLVYEGEHPLHHLLTDTRTTPIIAIIPHSLYILYIRLTWWWAMVITSTLFRPMFYSCCNFPLSPPIV